MRYFFVLPALNSTPQLSPMQVEKKHINLIMQRVAYKLKRKTKEKLHWRFYPGKDPNLTFVIRPTSDLELQQWVAWLIWSNSHKIQARYKTNWLFANNSKQIHAISLNIIYIIPV